MPLAIASQTDDVALKRRMALAGSSGPMAAFHNLRVVGIAMFACLGGLLYGYNQGVFSGMLYPPMYMVCTFLIGDRCPDHDCIRQPHGRLHTGFHQKGLADLDLGIGCLVWNTVLGILGRGAEPKICDFDQYRYLHSGCCYSMYSRVFVWCQFHSGWSFYYWYGCWFVVVSTSIRLSASLS